MTETVQEGRNALKRTLRREADREKENLLDAMAKAKEGIARAEARIAVGHGVPTSVSGEGMILGSHGSRIDVLASRWMDAERRFYRLLDIYDQTNGTTPDEDEGR